MAVEWRSRWTFWGATIAVLALVSVPSVEWATALRDYGRFLNDWQPAPLKPTITTFAPHGSWRPRGDAPVLKPVEFRHKAAKAKSVELVGDFNAWRPGLLKLSRGDGGMWSIVVPVPSGRCKYLFLVDGEPQVDAKGATADGPEGRRVSTRLVP